MNTPIKTHINADITRALRILTEREPRQDKINVVYHELETTYYATLNGKVVYTINDGSANHRPYLQLVASVPHHTRESIENMENAYTINADSLVAALFNLLDSVMATHKATDDEYLVVPALIDHYFDWFAGINSVTLSEALAARTIRYFNMCHYLSQYHIAFEVDQLASSRNRRPETATKGDEAVESFEDTPLRGTTAPVVMVDDAPFVDAELAELHRTPLDETVSTETHTEVIELDEPVKEPEPEPEETKPLISKHVGFTTDQILEHAVNGLMEHPIIKILRKIDHDDTEGFTPLNLKLLDKSEDFDKVLVKDSPNNPASYAELITLEFLSTYPNSNDVNTLNSFIYGKIAEYLPMMYSDKLLKIKDADYRSVYSLSEPSHWARCAGLTNVIHGLVARYASQLRAPLVDMSTHETETLGKVIASSHAKLRQTITELMTNGELSFEEHLGTTLTTRVNIDAGYFLLVETLKPEDNGAVQHQKLKLFSCTDSKFIITVMDIRYSNNNQDVEIGKTSYRQNTKGSDLGDIILVVANVTGIEVSKLLPQDLSDGEVKVNQ